MSTKSFQDLFKVAESSPDHWKRAANLGFVYAIDRLLFKMNKPRAYLASLTGIPESTISRNLNGKQNLTIATMVKMAEALDAAVRIHVEKKEIKGGWLPMVEMKPPKTEDRPGVDTVNPPVNVVKSVGFKVAATDLDVSAATG